MVYFRKSSNDAEHGETGVLQLVVRNSALQINTPTLVGIGDLFDDDDYFEALSSSSSTSNAATTDTSPSAPPVHIAVRNCSFSLNENVSLPTSDDDDDDDDDDAASNESDVNIRQLRIHVDAIGVRRMPNGDLVISECSFRTSTSSSNANASGIWSLAPASSNRPQSARPAASLFSASYSSYNAKSVLNSNNSNTNANTNDNELFSSGSVERKKSFDESVLDLFTGDSAAAADTTSPKSRHQMASLVRLVRQVREESRSLEAKCRDELAKRDAELVELKRSSASSSSSSTATTPSLTSPAAAASDSELGEVMKRFELERRQFESLLDKLMEENQALGAKLKRSEEHAQILHIENTCLVKRLGQQQQHQSPK